MAVCFGPAEEFPAPCASFTLQVSSATSVCEPPAFVLDLLHPWMLLMLSSRPPRCCRLQSNVSTFQRGMFGHVH